MRRPDWRERLAQWSAERVGAPFQWGDTDCALIVAEAVDTITGGRFALVYRNRYKSRGQAVGFQRRNQIDLARGLERAGVFRWQGDPQPGDIITYPHPPFVLGHVCLGPLVMSAREDIGVCYGRTSDAMKQPGATVWRIA